MTIWRASIAQNDNKNKNNVTFLFKSAVLNAVKTIRDKKKRADKGFIFDYLTKSLVSNLKMELKNVLAALVDNNRVIDKKTPTGLRSFHIVNDLSDRQNEINNLIENNHGDSNLDFNKNCPLLHYNIDTPYSQQVVSRPEGAKGELKLEARFSTLKNYIECEISSLNSKFHSDYDKSKTANTQEYEEMVTFRKSIDFLQNEVASKDAIDKTLIEMQTGILDSSANCGFQNKDNMPSINITDNSFIQVNNSDHKRKNNLI